MAAKSSVESSARAFQGSLAVKCADSPSFMKTVDQHQHTKTNHKENVLIYIGRN